MLITLGLRMPNQNPIQPLVAARALKTLMADPERTDQVFIILKALSGNSVRRSFLKFCGTPMGRRILNEERDLVETLRDQDALRAMPAGSLGSTYLAFVEAQNLSADGLVEASETGTEFDDANFARYAARTRDMHDLWHVLTGYGRDTLGEDCLLAFSYAQLRNPGVAVICFIAALKISRESRESVFGANWRAFRAGRAAAWLPAQDWEHLLTQPIDEVRKQLRIEAPKAYEAIRERWDGAVAA